MKNLSQDFVRSQNVLQTREACREFLLKELNSSEEVLESFPSALRALFQLAATENHF